MTPLVSVLTPAYNAAPYLAETVRSVLAQSYPRVEMIIVNDGSKDDTLAVAKSFTDPRIKVIDQENRGASAARNRAYAEAQGEFIQYLDADDLLHPAKAAVQVRRLYRHADCVAAGRWGRFTDDPVNARFTPEPFWTDLGPIDWLVNCWTSVSMMHPAAWLTPRSIIDHAGPWDERLSLNDDGEFFARVVLASRKVLFVNDAVSYYRSGLPSSLSGRKSDAAWQSAYRTVLDGAARLLTVADTPQTRKACARQFEDFVYACYPAVPLLRAELWRRVRDLGGPYSEPPLGPRMRLVSRLLGWRLAKRLERCMALCRPARTPR